MGDYYAIKDRKTGKEHNTSDVHIEGEFIVDREGNMYHGSNYDVQRQYSGCFIATALGADVGELDTLRKYRDEVLMETPVGTAFVNLYYTVSPSIAQCISRHPKIREKLRGTLLGKLVSYAAKKLENR